MKFTDRLAAIGIHNPHNLTSDGMPLITYSAHYGRDPIPSAWVVTVKGRRFKNTEWYEYGSKHFTGAAKGPRSKEPMEQAFALVKRMFPTVEMVKGPWPYTYVNKADLDKAKEAVKNLPKE